MLDISVCSAGSRERFPLVSACSIDRKPLHFRSGLRQRQAGRLPPPMSGLQLLALAGRKRRICRWELG